MLVMQSGPRSFFQIFQRPSVPDPTPAPAAGASEEWLHAFIQVFGAGPSPHQAAHLEFIAASSGEVTPRQRYRRIISGFDHQDLRTAFNVRWAAEDVRLHEVEGFSMYLDEADISVAQVIASGHYEPHLIAFFNAMLQPGMHVVDAGANIGFYSLLSARRVGPQGKVWSFEPNSENARLVLASAAHNAFSNIELHPVALGNVRGHVQFTSAIGSNGVFVDDEHRNLLDASCRIVPLARLDDFGIDRVDLFKMDVEGAEGLLLEGALGTIEQCRPLVVSEFSCEMLQRISGWEGARFIQAIADRGYAPFMCDKETHALVAVDDAVAFAQGFGRTGRIEDLVFCPRERLDTLPLAR